MPTTIENLIINIGEKDDSANALVPTLERDPLLIGLDRYAEQLRLRAGATSQGLQMKH